MSVGSIYAPLYAKRPKQIHLITAGGKVGGAAGWTLGAANDVGRLATMAASQTGGKLVVPIPFLKVYWAITAFYALGQIESAGNTVTFDLELRRLEAIAADIGNASVTTITQLSVTADTAISAVNSRKELSAPSVVDQNSTYFLIATATTAASTDIDLMALAVEITEY